MEHANRSTRPEARGSRLLLLLAALPPAACLGASPAPTLRYFEPSTRAPAGASTEAAPREPLRLALVTAREPLRERIVWRRSEVETILDDVNRWSADPADLVREALRDALYVRGEHAPAEGRDTPELSVHVVAFEGVLGSDPAARVALEATVRSADRATARTRRFEASVPIEGAEPEALAAGVGRALAALLDELAAWLR